MDVRILADKYELGKEAAKLGAAKIRAAIAEKGYANVILATGASQFEMLAALLEEHTGEKLLPSVLSKRLVRYAADLDKAGIHITSSRTRDSRQLHILCIDGDSNDGNDGKNETGSVSNLLSQPSQLSPET